MSKLKDAQDSIRVLSKKALEVVEDTTLTFPEKKTALDGLEADIKTASDIVAAEMFMDEKLKTYRGSAAGGDGGSLIEPGADHTGGQQTLKSLGAQFVESDGYKSLMGRGLKGGNWTSGDVELKTTLTEGTAGTPGGGYPFVQTPAVLPGIVDIRFKRLVVADLFPQGTTISPLIRYLVESAVTNAAAAVLEGGLKPESALTFAKVDEVLHKIATWLPISDEMLEDWQQARSYIDARLLLFVKIAEEAQLLTGDGTGANLVGLLNRAGLATPIVKGTAPSVAGDNSMDAVYRQITAIRFSSFLEPDAIVVDPLAWQTILLSKAATTGVYYANGPFANSQPDTLWGLPVVVTPAMAANTALVGAFQQGAQIFRKGGLTVEASNSHASFFINNLQAIRAEERLALAVYRPGAFGSVTGL